MKTLKEIWAAGEKALVNGHVWTVELLTGCERVHLSRIVQRPQYDRRTHMCWPGWRRVTIERSANMLAEAVREVGHGQPPP